MISSAVFVQTKGLGVVVVDVDILVNCGFELGNTTEGASANSFRGEVAEEALDEVELRAARGHEVRV